MFNRVKLWWESLCNGCGLCCYEKEFNGDIIFVNFEKPCEFLNCETNMCSIYCDRFKKNSDCRKLNLFEALFNPYLPGSCGYVKKIRFWKRRRNGW